MPDFYMHSRFAQDVADQLDHDIDQKTLLLGAQGPDPLYYPVTHDASKLYQTIADRLHDTNTAVTLSALTHYTKNHLTPPLLSFYIGYICHYALDVSVHPYIYYNVGDYLPFDPTTYEMRGLHLRFERTIDALLIEEDFNKRAHKVNLKAFFPTETPHSEITGAIQHIAGKITDKPLEDISMTEASHAMHKTLRWMFQDRFGIKKQCFKFIDFFFNKKSSLLLQDISIYIKPSSFDFLNTTHQTWHHPITNESFTDSIHDLYDHAMQFALRILDHTLPYITENSPVDLSNVFTNLSFNTGINCDQGMHLKHIQLYTKKQP
jgi:hypothetical protein